MGKFNLNEIKNLNKIEIFESKEGEPVKTIFTAYSTDGYNYPMGINANGFGGTQDFFRTGLGHVLGQRILGLSGAIDFDRRMFLTGASPMDFSVKCFLVLDEDLRKDILVPLNTLVDYTLPVRGKRLSDNARATITEANESGILNNGLFNFLKQGATWIKNEIGKAWVLEAPKQFSTQNGTTSLSIRIGNTQIDGVYIQKIDVSTPEFFIEDDFGNPVPSRLDITLSMSTLRGLTADIINFNKYKSANISSKATTNGGGLAR